MPGVCFNLSMPTVHDVMPSAVKLRFRVLWTLLLYLVPTISAHWQASTAHGWVGGQTLAVMIVIAKVLNSLTSTTAVGCRPTRLDRASFFIIII